MESRNHQVGAIRKWEDENEPLLRPSIDRFLGQSKNYPKMMDFTNKLLAVAWQPSVISMKQDVVDWPKLPHKEQTVIKRVHGFFAGADGIVNVNINTNYLKRIQTSEHTTFCEVQIGNEAVHKITYGNILTTLVPDSAELKNLMESIATDKFVKKKAEWAMRYAGEDVPFADQILAYICVEGIQFCASFLIIFYFKNKGLMPGMCAANEYISRDESLHVTAWTHVYFYDLVRKSTRAKQIITDAVDLECEFVRDMLGEDGLPGFKTEHVCEYVKMVADRICKDIGMEPMYNTINKFPFMEMIGISPRSNTFERRATGYAGRRVVGKRAKIEIDDNF